MNDDLTEDFRELLGLNGVIGQALAPRVRRRVEG